jgi:hypothetical protein
VVSQKESGIDIWELPLESGLVSFCSKIEVAELTRTAPASGYGATTLPALTESLTLNKNVTLAEHEAGRLKYLIEKLAQEIH